jgi:hypothetical protein
VRPDAGELAAKMSEALADPEAFASSMPDVAGLKARFGVDVMAAQIEKAYFSALEAGPRLPAGRMRRVNSRVS